MSTINTVLYGYSLFGSKPGNFSYDQQLTAVQESGFTSVILWTLHVHPNGDIYYNDTLLVSNGKYSNLTNPSFANYVKQLKSNGAVQYILFGLGSGGAADFAAIKQLLITQQGTALLVKNFNALQNAVPVDGFDFDLEEFPLENYTETVIQLSLILSKELKVFITFCPYCDPTFWINCLADIYQKNKKAQVVKWMNLQCYDGGSSNNPADWVGAIKNNITPTGISDPAQFVVPGYWCYNTTKKSFMGQCPQQIEKTFAILTTDDPGISGGFIWNSSDIFTNQDGNGCGGPMDCKAYAFAIYEGLQSKVPSSINQKEEIMQ